MAERLFFPNLDTLVWEIDHFIRDQEVEVTDDTKIRITGGGNYNQPFGISVYNKDATENGVYDFDDITTNGIWSSSYVDITLPYKEFRSYLEEHPGNADALLIEYNGSSSITAIKQLVIVQDKESREFSLV